MVVEDQTWVAMASIGHNWIVETLRDVQAPVELRKHSERLEFVVEWQRLVDPCHAANVERVV